jgi:hypothetical protein
MISIKWVVGLLLVLGFAWIAGNNQTESINNVVLIASLIGLYQASILIFFRRQYAPALLLIVLALLGINFAG